MEIKLNRVANKLIISSLIIFILFNSVLFKNETVLASKKISGGDAKAIVLIDQTTGKILYEENKDAVLGQASVTKLMTYYIVRNFLKSTNTPLTKKITVNADFSAVPSDGSQIKLKKGNTITIGNLIESLLIVSANDSAIQLEKMVEDMTGKDFLKLMNDKALELGLNSTHYVNTSGLTINNKGKKIYNTTTAYEISILAKKIIDEYPDTLKVTSKKNFLYNNIRYPNTNKLLLTYKNVDGLKTGFTSEAGYCLASTSAIIPKSKENKPFRLIAVTLGSSTDSARVGINSSVLKYGIKNFQNKKIAKKEKVYNLHSEYHKEGIIPACVKNDVYYLLKSGSKVNTKVKLNQDVKGKVKKGDVVGKITVTIDGVSLEEDLVSTKDVEGVGILKRIGLFFQGIFK